MAHEELKAQWAPGQSWETTNEGTDGRWTPIHSRVEPVWDQHQLYRRRPDPVVVVPKVGMAQRVADMNTAFGNPKGDPMAIDWGRVARQVMNIPDEFGELCIALGGDADTVKVLVSQFKTALMHQLDRSSQLVDLEQVRDSLCDINVFSLGAHHFMGIDADADMDAVVDGVMTRFVKDEADKAATIAKHAAAGVTDVYFEGDYPTMIMKSASDQPDAPKGKFLKSASYKTTVFPPV